MLGYTEADYENSIIELFRTMGYRYVYAPDLDRDLRSPLYEDELRDALYRLNPAMPDVAIGEAYAKPERFADCSH